MSTLGFLSNKLDREQTLLQELNEALLGIQAEAVGRAADLGYQKEDLDRFRQRLAEFVVRLQREIGETTGTSSLSPIIARLREDGSKSADDWKEDLAELLTALQNGTHLPDNLAGVLEQLLGILDVQLTKDFNRLYSR